jgi:hypothetical protein
MSSENSPFIAAYQGYFRNLLKWEELDRLWEHMRGTAHKAWYLYAVGETPPQQPTDNTQLHHVIAQLDELLRSEHEEDYCGIVYVDNPEDPTLIKIYDPNNLGSVCGSGSAPPPLPGWVLSILPPSDLNAAFPPPAGRRRWWQRILG